MASLLALAAWIAIWGASLLPDHWHPAGVKDPCAVCKAGNLALSQQAASPGVWPPESARGELAISPTAPPAETICSLPLSRGPPTA